jgi:hypothetical protein
MLHPDQMLKHENATSALGKPREATNRAKRHDLLIARLQARLDALSTEQEDIAEAREQLLVEREEVLMNRRSIREQRLLVGNTEITLMDAFRKHFKTLPRPLPDDILFAYDEAEKQNMKLRRLEEELLQTDENLGASEWKFTEMETEFYQYRIPETLLEELDELQEIDVDSSNDKKVEMKTKTSGSTAESLHPTRRVQFEVLVAEHNHLTNRFNALRKQQSIRLDVFTQPGDESYRLAEDTEVFHEATSQAGEVLDLIAKCEARLQQLRPSLEPATIIGSTTKHPISEPYNYHNAWSEHLHIPSRAHSEGEVIASEDFIPVEQQIGYWSIQSLKGSALERLRFLNILRQSIKSQNEREFNFEHWEPHITRSWLSDCVQDLGWSGKDSPRDDRELKEPGEMITQYPLRDERTKYNVPLGSTVTEVLASSGASVGSQNTFPSSIPKQTTIQPFVLTIAPPTHETDHSNDRKPAPMFIPRSLTSVDSSSAASQIVLQEKRNEIPSEELLTVQDSNTADQRSIRRDSAQASDKGKLTFATSSRENSILIRQRGIKTEESKEIPYIPSIFKPRGRRERKGWSLRWLSASEK